VGLTARDGRAETDVREHWRAETDVREHWKDASTESKSDCAHVKLGRTQQHAVARTMSTRHDIDCTAVLFSKDSSTGDGDHGATVM